MNASTVVISQKSSEAYLVSYWEDMFKFRMAKEQEIWRLEIFALGYYAQQLDFEKKEERVSEHANFLDFVKNSKRPFGNKNIPQSIIYCLGWDAQWSMRIKCQPEFVTDEANKLHKALIENIEKNWGKENMLNDDIWRL